MPYFILALTFGAVGLSFYQYFTPDTSSFMSISLSNDLLWIPVLGFWACILWETSFKPNQTFSSLKPFIVTPILATLTLGTTQLNWGLNMGLLISQHEMLTIARSLKGSHGSGRIGLFEFAEFWRTNERSVFVLSNPSEGAHTGFIYTEKPLDEGESIVGGRLLTEPHIIDMGGNWSYWRHDYDPY